MKFDVTQSRTEYLKTLYKAHEKIENIKGNIYKLYDSIMSISSKNDNISESQLDSPYFQNATVEIIQLKREAERLLKKRAAFDLFICTLSLFEYDLLNLRCGECRSWKETAATLDISNKTAKRYFEKICERAEEKGIFSIPEE
jgi:hypothetical protein